MSFFDTTAIKIPYPSFVCMKHHKKYETEGGIKNKMQMIKTFKNFLLKFSFSTLKFLLLLLGKKNEKFVK